MRKTLLLSTAAVIAGIAMASAQTVPGQPGSDKNNQHGGAQVSQPQGARGQADETKSGAPGAAANGQLRNQHEDKLNQAQQADKKPGNAGSSRASGQAAQQPESGPGAKSAGTEHQPPRTSGSAQRDETEQKQGAAQDKGAKPSSSKSQSMEQSQSARPQLNENAKANQPQQNDGVKATQQAQPQNRAATATQSSSAGTVTLTPEQSSKIQQTVLARSDVPRVDRVDFALNVGTAVPSHVRVVEVPPALIEIHPEWRGDEYFVVEDEIVIVDHGRRVVAVVPTGGRSHAAYGAAIDLSPQEIHELQVVLIQRGFYHGNPDGVWGPATREALVTFQRQQGIETTGEIDTRTISMLGLSDKIKSQGAQTVGRGSTGSINGSSSQQPALNSQSRDAMPQNQSSAGESNARSKSSGQSPQAPSTSGQAPSASSNAAGANQPLSRSGSSSHKSAIDGGTSGQAGSSMQPSETNPAASSKEKLRDERK